ncbi:hypothetical protein N0V88_002615 [Collariella sp. IMI 366227]|nr:hypothetical protein N0V88_002615 [Collariella sp. IMI 366227]
MTDPRVSRFCSQVLQLEPTPDFPELELLCDEDVQETIYERLFSDAVELPPPRRYQLRILKALMSKIESSIVDWDRHGISDSLMSSLSLLLSKPLPSETDAAQQRCYVTYHLSLLQTETAYPNPHITILESRSLISAAGTTGLRTWEAALHLGQYLCKNPSLVENKRILELGTGTGYLAVLCAKYLGSEHVMASDGSDEVVSKLQDSFFLNEEEAWNGGRKLDMVLGADITYDVSVIPALVATLQELAGLFPGIEIVIAATERNRATFESFLEACAKRGFALSHASFAVPSRSEQRGPFYKDESPIHICQLKK